MVHILQQGDVKGKWEVGNNTGIAGKIPGLTGHGSSLGLTSN